MPRKQNISTYFLALNQRFRQEGCVKYIIVLEKTSS